jgi:hypothetical protein
MRPMPEDAEEHLSDARRTAIAFLAKKRRAEQ